jgi:hypothetical protein
MKELLIIAMSASLFGVACGFAASELRHRNDPAETRAEAEAEADKSAEDADTADAAAQLEDEFEIAADPKVAVPAVNALIASKDDFRLVNAWLCGACPEARELALAYLVGREQAADGQTAEAEYARLRLWQLDRLSREMDVRRDEVRRVAIRLLTKKGLSLGDAAAALDGRPMPSPRPAPATSAKPTAAVPVSGR